MAANSAGLFVIPLLQNPLPGHQGNLGYNTMRTIARRRIDGSINKNFRLPKSKSISVKIDATNILNHPQDRIPLDWIKSATLRGHRPRLHLPSAHSSEILNLPIMTGLCRIDCGIFSWHRIAGIDISCER